MINKLKYRIKLLKEYYPYTKGARKFFIIIFLLGLVSLGLELVIPMFYKMFVDEVILAAQYEFMLKVATGYLGIFFIQTVIGYIKNYSSYTLNYTVLYRVKYKIWNSYLHMPLSKYEVTSIGDMKMRLDDDTSQISNFVEYQTVDYIISFVTLLISTVLIFIISWQMAIFSIIVIPLTFRIDNILSKKERVLKNGNRENDQNLSSWLHASVQGWREVKALNLQKYQKRKYLKFLYNYAMYFAKWINYWTARVLVIPKIKNELLMQFALYFIGGLLIISGELRISDLLVFVMYYDKLSLAVKAISSKDAELQANMPFTNRLSEELTNDYSEASKGKMLIKNIDTITFRDVCFRYPHGHAPVIQNLNLEIHRGERVAIVGESGCGKTTLLKLMTGMLTPTSGTIYYSGIDIQEIDESSLFSHIGFVMQQNLLFNTTIKENLLYGKSDATEEELIDVCRKANIYDYIKELPDGFDTMIGEKGLKLSGGQRQRIILARLFLKDVNIFIFDEATSALDQQNESIIYDAINKIAEDKTIIIVAHRESSISICDRIIRL